MTKYEALLAAYEAQDEVRERLRLSTEDYLGAFYEYRDEYLAIKSPTLEQEYEYVRVMHYYNRLFPDTRFPDNGYYDF